MSDETEKESMRRLREALPEETEKWLIEKILLIAMKHDIAGPDIRRVSETVYQQQLAREMHRCAMAAHLAGEIVMPMAGIDTLCSFMGRDIIAMRQCKQCHQAGEIMGEELHDWEAYETYQRYFEDDQPLLLTAVLEAAMERREEKRHAGDGAESSIVNAVGSTQTYESLEADQEWSKHVVWSFALLEDFSGIPCEGMSKRAYVERAICQLVPTIREEIQRHNISVPSLGVEPYARQLAAEVRVIRRLNHNWTTGKLSDQALKQMPLYHKYKVYFVPEHEKIALMLCYGLIAKGFQDLDNANGN